MKKLYLLEFTLLDRSAAITAAKYLDWFASFPVVVTTVRDFIDHLAVLLGSDSPA